MNINVRNELQGDELAIEAVTQAAFKDAPHSGHTEHFIIKALRKANKLSVSLVAEADGVIVGHVAVSPVAITDGSRGWFGLGPISVSPEHQHKGIGSQLMERALTVMKSQGASGCVLLGDPSYYQRFGFRNEQGLIFPGVPQEYFQAISFGSQVPEGEVSYHEAFHAQS